MAGEFFEYIGNLFPDDQEKLINAIASKFFRGDSKQKREKAEKLVIPILEESSFHSYSEAFTTVASGLGAPESHSSVEHRKRSGL